MSKFLIEAGLSKNSFQQKLCKSGPVLNCIPKAAVDVFCRYETVSEETNHSLMQFLS